MSHEYLVVEGVESTFRYHLCRSDQSPVMSLCGRATMHTQCPLSAWGTVTHLREKWCEDCWKIKESEEAENDN